MIKTREIELSKSRYFNILSRIRMLQGWYVYLLPFVAALAIHLLMENPGWLVKFLLVYGVVNPLWILVYLWIHVNSNKSKSVSIKRHYEISPEKITAFHEDGSENEFLIEDIKEVRQFKNEILLYLSKSEFIYIPLDSLDEDDMNKLMNLLGEAAKTV